MGGRVANSGRYCRGCGARLARDNTATHCTACARRMSAAAGAPPAVPGVFWDSDVIRAALASRHIGRVIRAYRYHPHHGGRPLPQQRVGGWLGLTQAQLSRVENGPAVTDLTRLTAWAGTLAIPADRLWFHLPGQSEPTDQADAHGAYAAPRSTTSPARVSVDTDESTDTGAGGEEVRRSEFLAAAGPAGVSERAAQLAAGADGMATAAGELAGLLAQLEDSGTNDAAVERLSSLTAALAESHTGAPARSVLDQALRLHGQARRMLGGRLRLSQRRHLYRIESELLAHVCLLQGDLKNDDLADRYGLLALRFAEEAGSNEALACTALAKTYRWQDRLLESAEIARRGYERSPATPIRVQLAAQEANAAALFGDVSRAREAMSRAERDAETVAPDSGVSAWSFGRGRQAVFALSVANQTGDPAGALQAANVADAGWANGEPRVPANWAQVRIGAAIAHLALGALDAAIAEVEPVLTLPPEMRIATVTAYTTAVGRQLGGPQYRDNRSAMELLQKVKDFNTGALPGGLPKASNG